MCRHHGNGPCGSKLQIEIYAWSFEEARKQRRYIINVQQIMVSQVKLNDEGQGQVRYDGYQPVLRGKELPLAEGSSFPLSLSTLHRLVTVLSTAYKRNFTYVLVYFK